MFFALRDVFDRFAHVVSASTFLILLAVVAILQKNRPAVRTRQEFAANAEVSAPQQRMKKSLPWIGIAMLITLVPVVFIFLGLLNPEDTIIPTLVLWVEVIALALFTLFWFIETRRKWNDPAA